jgi:hypothetical protein
MINENDASCKFLPNVNELTMFMHVDATDHLTAKNSESFFARPMLQEIQIVYKKGRARHGR